ncbi:hypothetical protein Q3C01_15985 [Bradyrhizobium sp. UFLA05-109]
MKKILFVTATAIALAVMGPTFVAEAAGLADTNAQVDDPSGFCSFSPATEWLCRTFSCLADPDCS